MSMATIFTISSKKTELISLLRKKKRWKLMTAFEHVIQKNFNAPSRKIKFIFTTL